MTDTRWWNFWERAYGVHNIRKKIEELLPKIDRWAVPTSIGRISVTGNTHVDVPEFEQSDIEAMLDEELEEITRINP